MNTFYYVRLDGDEFGPYELDQLRDFALMPDIQVYSTATSRWASADSYPELRDYLNNDNNGGSLAELSYYLNLGNSVHGPYSLVELSFLDIDPTTLLSIDNMANWYMAREIPGLLSELSMLVESDVNVGGSDSEKVDINAYIVNVPSENDFKKEELEAVIEEQETEIMSLKEQLEAMDEKLSRNASSHDEIPMFDMDEIQFSKYSELKREITACLKRNVYVADNGNRVYRRMFPSADVERSYYVDEYRRFIDSFKSTLATVIEKLQGVQSTYENDIILLDNNVQLLRNKIINSSRQEEQELIATVNSQIDALKRISNNEMAINSLKQYMNSRKVEILAKYRGMQTEELEQISNKKRELKTAFDDLQRSIVDTIEQLYGECARYYDDYFNGLYETSEINHPMWAEITDRNTMPSSVVKVGHMEHRYSILGKDVCVVENCYVELFDSKNLIIRHNNSNKSQAIKIVNNVLGRLMASSSPGKMNIAMVDADEMDGTSDAFKLFNRNLFQILVRSEEIRKYLDDTERYIGDIIKNLLTGSVRSLYEYNQSKESKEPYHVIVIEDFPQGVGTESLYLLEKVLKNGIRAGVNIIFLVNEDKINNSEDMRKSYHNSHLEQYESSCTVFNLNDVGTRPYIYFDDLNEKYQRSIVQYVNSGVEVHKEEALLFADYIPDKSEWWSQRSAKLIEIPFGVLENRQIQKLKITQESGQNSAVVIGIPGSGKSVFLHALICNAAIHYSPDELNMYLIDFSGVEFNTYALHNLPHARVIAPEAEREFGLSILNELVEEGKRRMDLCRENGVSNIVDLKAKDPSIHVPRLLVIIDEFQKIFEIDNDNISNQANSNIHIIVQEYRKFGINLILATQKLPSSYVLPKDLIANRVVFKSSPNDFSALIDMEGTYKVPKLQTGECVYNSESGASYDNNFTKCFLVTKSDIDNILDKIANYAQQQNYTPKHNLLVFRSDELPDFRTRKMRAAHMEQYEIPNEVGIYLGEYISVSDVDVNITLCKESSNNILVMGGESYVAEKIPYYAMLSAAYAHKEYTATFINLNFLKQDNNLNEEIHSVFSYLAFDSVIISKKDEVLDNLTKIKDIITERINHEDIPQNHIYIGIYGFQQGRMFDEEGEYDDPSECSEILNYILKNGPFVGVFTILQCDNMRNLKRISGSALSNFSYRIALQMSENESYAIVDTSVANKLYDIKRPSSIYRAYFRDNNRNTIVKFKPYN